MKLKTGIKLLKTHVTWITACIATITAILSLIMTWYTLQEMRIDRENAYKPDVIIMQEGYELETKALISIDDEGDICVLNSSDIYSFTIRNIGVGTAKNVRIAFDEKSAVDMANWIKKNTKYGEEMKISKIEGGYLIMYWTGGRDIRGFSTSGGYREILYILPDAKQEYSMVVPDAYVDLIQKSHFLDVDSPPLTVKVTWQDVQGKTYKKEYILEESTVYGDVIGLEDKEENIKYIKDNWELYKNKDGNYEEKIWLHVREYN